MTSLRPIRFKKFIVWLLECEVDGFPKMDWDGNGAAKDPIGIHVTASTIKQASAMVTAMFANSGAVYRVAWVTCDATNRMYDSDGAVWRGPYPWTN